MSKKDSLKKRRLGKKVKQLRRLPLLAQLKTHRRLESNAFARSWRRSKLRIKDE